MVRIIIERHIKQGKERELENLLIELRSKAMLQPGYISGETLTAVDNPSVRLVISTWHSIEHWKAWENNPERQELSAKMETLLVAPARTTAYAFRGEEKPKHTG